MSITLHSRKFSAGLYAIQLIVLVLLALLCMTQVAIAGSGKTKGDSAHNQVHTYGKWTVNCNQAQTKKGSIQHCSMYQERVEVKAHKRVLLLAFQRFRRKVEISVVGPFGVLLNQGVAISVDVKKTIKHLDFLTCMADGCLATGSMTNRDIRLLTKGGTAKVSFHTLNGSVISFDVPMAGFKTAWKHLPVEHAETRAVKTR